MMHGQQNVKFSTAGLVSWIGSRRRAEWSV